MRFSIASLVVIGVYLINTAAAAATTKTMKHIDRIPAKAATGTRVLNKRQSCPAGFGFCSNTGFCCPLGGECCSDGNCCEPGFQCWISHLGGLGCCPDGEVCS